MALAKTLQQDPAWARLLGRGREAYADWRAERHGATPDCWMAALRAGGVGGLHPLAHDLNAAGLPSTPSTIRYLCGCAV